MSCLCGRMFCRIVLSSQLTAVRCYMTEALSDLSVCTGCCIKRADLRYQILSSLFWCDPALSHRRVQQRWYTVLFLGI